MGGPSCAWDCSTPSAAGLRSVEESIAPSFAEGERLSSKVPGGWIGSYSSLRGVRYYLETVAGGITNVASRPASLRIIFEPPG